jgi:hypothetical protein
VLRTALRALLCVAAFLAALVAAAPASAGTYTVYSCGGPAGGANNLFRGQADGGMTAYYANCPANPYAASDDMGLEARAVRSNGSAGALNGAYLVMDAPGGATISGLHADVNMNRPYAASPYWSLGVFGFGTDADRGINTNAAMVWGCPAPSGFSQCFAAHHIDLGIGKPSVRFEVRCGAPNFGSCSTIADNPSVAYISAWNISVDVSDDTAPSIGSISGGLASGAWQRGTQTINWSSSDNVGIRSASLDVDGNQVTNWNNNCDYTQVVPCSQLPSGSFSFNTDSLSDGSHAVALYVTDTAGNTSSWSNTIYVDHSAPAAPTVATSGSWQNNNAFSATVTNAGSQNAPVAKIYYRVCDASGANCGGVLQATPSNGGNGGATTISGITAAQDGDYTVRAYEQDAAGNVDSSTLSDAATAHLRLDRTAPAAPTALAADGSGAWESTNSFRVSWTNPGGQLAPITKAYIVVCNASNACTTSSQSASEINQASGVGVPAVGDYTSTVYLQDAAGNTAIANKSSAVHLRFDNTVPGMAQPTINNGWLNAAQAQAYGQTITYPKSEAKLPSGVAGYSFTDNGLDPDTTQDVTVTDPSGTDAFWSAKTTLTDLPEGTSTVKARAISGSGVAGAAFGVTTLKVDKTAPTASVDGAPDPGSWQTSAVKFAINASDALSGMTAAPAGSPVSNGGYVSYGLDDGQPVNVAGPTAKALVDSDGVHTVYYTAYDVAGNPSPEQSVKVRIDVTAPTGSFEARDAHNPTQFVADVSDAASGVAGGAIQIRSDGDWQSLPTSYDGAGHLVAKVDDTRIPQGMYAMRALVTDDAGNQGVVDTRSDGSQMQVAFPLRGATAMDASSKIVAVTSCKTVKVTRLRKGKKVTKKFKVCKATKLPAKKKGAKRLVVKPTVKKTNYLYVHLKDAAGNPIKDAAVTIDEQPRTGGDFTVKARLGTDQNGNVLYAIARTGPSRTIRASFAGSDLLLPSSNAIKLLVKSSTTLKASKKRMRAPGRVVFSGKLAGGYIPPAGKLVNLQVFFRHKWRTFATPRAAAKTGAWRYTYKFTARYVKPLTYKFRALVPIEQAYPFEAGGSSVAKVVVRP